MNLFKIVVLSSVLLGTFTTYPMKRQRDQASEENPTKKKRVNLSSESSNDKITLVTSDGVKIVVDRSLLEASKTITDLLVNMGESAATTNIPLRSISSTTFQTIVKCLQSPEETSNIIDSLTLDELATLADGAQFLELSELFTSCNLAINYKQRCHILSAGVSDADYERDYSTTFTSGTLRISWDDAGNDEWITVSPELAELLSQHSPYLNAAIDFNAHRNRHALPIRLAGSEMVVNYILNIFQRVLTCKKSCDLLTDQYAEYEKLMDAIHNKIATIGAIDLSQPLKAMKTVLSEKIYDLVTTLHNGSVAEIRAKNDTYGLANLIRALDFLMLPQENFTDDCVTTLISQINALQSNQEIIGHLMMAHPLPPTISHECATKLSCYNNVTSKLISCNTLQDHKGQVKSIAFSPDGKILASCSYDKTIKLRNVENGSIIATLKDHTGLVSNIAFNPDGKILASCSDDNTIKLWNAEDYSLITTLQGHESWVSSIAFSPDGKTLASGSGDNRIKLWNAEDYSLIATLQGHEGWVLSIAFSPDGKALASCSDDKTIKLWSAEDYSLLATLQGHKNWVNSIAFSPDGKVLASCSFDKTIKLWNIEDYSLLATLQDNEGCVRSIAFSPHGKTLASGSDDETIRLWDIENVKPLDTLTFEQVLLLKIIFDAQENLEKLLANETLKALFDSLPESIRRYLR